MLVALSSHAAPRASLQELIDGCARRGLFALHLVPGHAHGIEADAAPQEIAGIRVVTASTNCIEVNAAVEDVDAAVRTRLDGSVDLIVLRGAGPEAAQHEGRGIGALMTRLTLSGYRGVLSLAPSSNAVLPVWRTWLQQGRKWGCGSKTADESLVQLGEMS